MCRDSQTVCAIESIQLILMDWVWWGKFQFTQCVKKHWLTQYQRQCATHAFEIVRLLCKFILGRSLYKLEDAIIHQPKWLNFVRSTISSILRSSGHLWNFSMVLRFACYSHFRVRWWVELGGAANIYFAFHEQWNVMFVWPSRLMEFQQTIPKTVLSFILCAINISPPHFSILLFILANTLAQGVCARAEHFISLMEMCSV